MIDTQNWSAKTIPQLMEALHTNERGLSNNEALQRQEKFGLNQLPEEKVDSLLTIFGRQFQSPLIYLLFVAGAVVFIMGEPIDGAIIFFVLLFNAVVGTIQEGKAQNTLRALKNFVETKATVRRDETQLIIPDSEIVPGDIILLQEGERVPADARLLIANNLKLDEASLTGESEPRHKTVNDLEKNMIFKGTHIVSGNGQAIVIATGTKTIIGKIAKQISKLDTEIPLKKDIRNLSHLIIIVVMGISLFLFTAGVLLGKPIREMLTTVISLAVSVIPEGLPIVVTLILATGVWRMSKRNALIKKLQAVEALGQARIIAVDKTGTLTKNELVIQQVFVDQKMFSIGGVGYEPKGDITENGKVIDPINEPGLALTGKIASFCANARVILHPETNQWQVAGDPTEASMFVFGQKVGFHKNVLENDMPMLAEIPFDYQLKYHTVLHGRDDKKILTVVGAPEIILNLTTKVWHNGKHHPLSDKEKMELEAIFSQMSQTGLRVLAFAESHESEKILTPETIKNLAFVGFFGIRDALRVEVPEAMSQAQAAGIRVVMITGDHKITAQAIAQMAGIYHEGDYTLTGEEIDKLSTQELIQKLARTSVFARVTPNHKLLIIQAFKARGEIVVMTGDGVNDAPSLVAADLGVAMGKIGTEVAKEAADIVLLDDNFQSITTAIEEGRSIYKTIKKVILYLFSTSLGEVLTITGAIFLGLPLPILAAQIIWLNLVTDGFLDISLAMEPKESGLLQHTFERPKKYLVDKLMAKRMILMALPMAIGTLILFKNYLGNDMTKAWTMSLTLLAAFQWANAWNCRSEDKSIFELNFLANKFLLGATTIVISLQMFAIYNPMMQKILHTTAISLRDWLIIIPISLTIILVEEVRKLFQRYKNLSRRRESDSRPPSYQDGVLPLNYSGN